MGDGQLSFFSAGVGPAAVDDVEGLLCGPGQVVRRDGAARVSVVVREPWRVALLLAAMAETGLDGEAADPAGPAGQAGDAGDAGDAGTAVRTAFDPRLAGLADRWSGGAGKRAPADLALDGPRLRWWALAAGRDDGQGYVLGLGPQDEAVWQPVGAALVKVGLPAALLGPRADGPAYRVSGRRRLARLAELVGAPPAGCPEGCWPGARS